MLNFNSLSKNLQMENKKNCGINCYNILEENFVKNMETSRQNCTICTESVNNAKDDPLKYISGTQLGFSMAGA